MVASGQHLPARYRRFVGAAVPKEDWPDDEKSLMRIKRSWEPGVGDARQELVLIGIDMDETAFRANLDAYLLDDAEMAAGRNNGPITGIRSIGETEN